MQELAVAYHTQLWWAKQLVSGAFLHVSENSKRLTCMHRFFHVLLSREKVLPSRLRNCSRVCTGFFACHFHVSSAWFTSAAHVSGGSITCACNAWQAVAAGSTHANPGYFHVWLPRTIFTINSVAMRKLNLQAPDAVSARTFCEARRRARRST